jgi:nitrate reductase NapE component
MIPVFNGRTIQIMDDLKSELNDLKQFIAELKADRAATKEKERREAWTKYVSLTVVVFAVIASQWGGSYSSKTQLAQAQASDEWNYYQAQSVKQHMFELTRSQLPKSAGESEMAGAKKDFDAKIAEYEKRRADSKTEATRLENKRDVYSKIGGRLGLAISCFSVAIATASLCLLTKKKPLWFCSMIFAAVGIAQMVAAKTIIIP